MLPHCLQAYYPLILFLFIKMLQNFGLGYHIYGLLTCELNCMQYPEGPPINFKHYYLKKSMHSNDKGSFCISTKKIVQSNEV